MRENCGIIGLAPSHRDLLSICSCDVLEKIQAGDPAWEQLVPATVAEIIRRKQLFGWQPSGASVPASGAMSTQQDRRHACLNREASRNQIPINLFARQLHQVIREALQ